MTAPRSGWAAALLLLLFAVLATHALRTKSATFDEGVYVAAGYTHLKAGDHRLLSVHPPLARLLSAAPLLARPVRVEWGDAAWREAEPWDFAHRLLYRWNDAEVLLIPARLATVALAIGLGAAVFLWVRAHAGPAAGLLSLFVLAVDPEVLAHGQLATNDLAVAAFVFASVASFERLARRATWRWLLATGLATGGAVASKFSGLAVVPMLGVLALAVAFARPALELDLWCWPGRGAPARAPARKLAHLGGMLAVVSALALAVVWACYGFRFAASSDPAAPGLAWTRVEPGVAARLVLEHRLLPEAYVHGFLDTVRRSRGRPAFLMGARSEEGWWWFFPAAFALKTPLALLVLLAATVAFGWKVAGRGRFEAFVWVPVVVYSAFALTSHVNIGARFLLPLHPFLAAAVGRWGPWAVAGGRARRWALAAWAVWYASAAASIHPHYLAHFNALGGGPDKAYRHLVDSSLDWGQDLKGLGAYVKAHGIRRLKLSYFGTADPAYYGLGDDLLPGSMRPRPERVALVVQPGDLVAVSATNLQGVYLPPAAWPLMEQLRARPPQGSIGHSILLWRADFAWAMPPREAAALGWLDEAVRSYREALGRDAAWAEGHALLGQALHMQGHHRRAVAALEEARRLDDTLFGRRPELARAYESARRARQPPAAATAPAGGRR